MVVVIPAVSLGQRPRLTVLLILSDRQNLFLATYFIAFRFTYSVFTYYFSIMFVAL